MNVAIPSDDEGYTPSIADVEYEGPIFDDDLEEPARGAAEGAPEPASASSKPAESAEPPVSSPPPSAPPHPADSKVLAELADGEPTDEAKLRAEANTPEHMLTHFPKNPYCKLCNIAKNTSVRVARKPDGKSQMIS